MKSAEEKKEITSPEAEKDGHESDASQNENDQNMQRQDAFVVFANEKDLRHHESIRIKASLYTGIAVRVKIITPQSMENLLNAIDLDHQANQKEKNAGAISPQKSQSNIGLADVVEQLTAVRKGIVNLRFEDCKFTRKSISILYDFLKTKPILETLGLQKVSFEDIIDFKKLTEGMQISVRLTKITFWQMVFDEEIYGKAIGRALLDSRSIRELDISYATFEHPKCFYDLCSAILNERCRINVFKLRGINITQLEGKILRYILMKNKQLTTLDFSSCRADETEFFNCFLEKLDQFCNIRYLTLENMKPDISLVIETLGEALAENTKLEVLILRENKIKWINYQNFWNQLMPNTTLQKINLHKTELNDRVLEKMVTYLEQQQIQLADLDLSKNQITDAGLKVLAQSLKVNKSLKYLNLSQNKIKEEGLYDMADYLAVNKTLIELSLGGNIINNEGITLLSHFLPHNDTLKHLDLSRNMFSDLGFANFAAAMRSNKGLEFLDIAKNKDVTDEDSLTILAESLVDNKTLKHLDLTGIVVRKPFLKQFFEPALKKNITLQRVIGKIPAGIINYELEMNVQITNEVLPLFTKLVKLPRNITFNLTQVEPDADNYTYLNLKDKPHKLIKSAFKLIQNFDIRCVDFTNSGVNDDSIRLLAAYLRENPNLRSVTLDQNTFTDDGLQRVNEALRINTKLAHLSIRECPHITDKGLANLCDVISTKNTVLFQIDLDVDQFDRDLAITVITESALNRDIQEKLKPVMQPCYFADTAQVPTQPDKPPVNPKEVMRQAEEIGRNMRSQNTASTDNALKSPNKQAVHELNNPGDAQSDDRKSQGSGDILPVTGGRDSSTKVDRDAAMLIINKEFNTNSEREEKREEPKDGSQKSLCEVKFNESANLADCFASALKTWRIYRPNVINIIDQRLTDAHVEELCKFLTDKEMVVRLNLRRNQISNEGAKHLGKFISEGDSTLTHLDVTRNRIGEDGGQALLNALYLTTRVIECQISYGNMISNKMGRIFEREIKANKQANLPRLDQPNQSHTDKGNGKKSAHKHRYELVDKGNDFMRCAIKTTELQNIMILSLPDNMLGLEDARMVSDMIRRNPSLKILNLRQNKMDADSAQLIANALVFNDKLKILDLSCNVLGDYGVQVLLSVIIRKQMHALEITPKNTPLLKEKDMRSAKNLVDCTKQIKNQKILSELRVLRLEQNETSIEIFKQIWLALELDKDVSIFVEDPALLIERQEEKKRAEIEATQPKPKFKPLAKIPKNKISVVVEPLEEGKQEGEKLNGSGEEAPPANPEDSQSQSEEDLDTEEEERRLEEHNRLEALERKRLFRLKWRKRFIGCSKKFCCFKDEEEEFDEEENMPSCKQVCCWRFLRSRRMANRYHTSVGSLEALEQSKCQGFVAFMLILNYLMFYAITLAPFILMFTIKQDEVPADQAVAADQSTPADATAETPTTLADAQVPAEANLICDADGVCLTSEEIFVKEFNKMMLMFNGGIIIYSLILEAVLIGFQKRHANIACCNGYLVAQVVTGVTARAVILLSAQLVAAFLRTGDAFAGTLGTALGIALIFSQLRAVQIFLAALTSDKTMIQPRIQQNYKLSFSTFFFGLAVIYKKLGVEPSNQSIEACKNASEERRMMMSLTGDDDKPKTKKISLKQRLSKCVICKFGSPKYWEMMLNDLPLLACVPFGYTYGVADEFMIYMTLVMSIFDFFAMLTYLSHEEELSLDAHEVFLKVEKRNQQNVSKITKIEQQPEDENDSDSDESESIDTPQKSESDNQAGDDSQKGPGSRHNDSALDSVDISPNLQRQKSNISPILQRQKSNAGQVRDQRSRSEDADEGKTAHAGDRRHSPRGDVALNMTNTSLELNQTAQQFVNKRA